MISTKLWFYGQDNNDFAKLWRACYLLHDYTRKCARVIIANFDTCPTLEELESIVADLRRNIRHPTPAPSPPEWQFTPEQALLIPDQLIPSLLETTLDKLPEDLRAYRKGKNRWWTRWRDFTKIAFPVETISFENDMLCIISSGGRARVFNRGIARRLHSLRAAGRVDYYEITRGRTYEGFYSFNLIAHATPRQPKRPHPAQPAHETSPREERAPIRLKLPLDDMINYVLRRPNNNDAILETAQIYKSQGKHGKAYSLALLSLMCENTNINPRETKEYILAITRQSRTAPAMTESRFHYSYANLPTEPPL